MNTDKTDHREWTEQGRKAYDTPSLDVIGSVKDLTEGTVVTGGDAFLTGTTGS